MFVGEKGRLIADYGKYQLLPEEFAKSFQVPPQSIPKSLGHHKEWCEAIKTGGVTTCHFGYSGRSPRRSCLATSRIAPARS